MAPRYMHSQAFADLPAVERAAHHIAALREHENSARLALGYEVHDDLNWRGRRIEGHAIRAFVALLEVLS